MIPQQTASNVNQNPFLPTAVFLPQEFEQMLIRLNTYLTQMSIFINQREVANYPLTEIQTGQRWFSEQPQSVVNPQNSTFRSGFRQTYIVGAIVANTTLAIPHNIQNLVLITHWSGSVITEIDDFRPIPYASTTNVNIQMSLAADTTNIYIGVGSGAPNVVSGIVTLEYLRN